MGDKLTPLFFRRAGPMPTLIRFFVILLFLAAIVAGGMVALTIFVDPQEEDRVVRIPSRDLFGE